MSTSYLFKGNLRGFFCDHCSENLSGLVIRLYKTQPEQRVTELAVANPKETFRELTAEAVAAKRSFLLAETKTDEAGNFSVTLSSDSYGGEAFDIDFECGNVPFHIPPKPRGNPVFYFALTTLQPQWREAAGRESANQQQEAALIYSWNYSIPAKWWCSIRARFGAYVICGQVTDCETKTPLGGLKVSAFDVDLIEDDPLGTAITDASGHFVLYYSEAAFSKTIFSWLNVEWPAGPDLYFRITTGDGQVLLQEPRSKGHEPGRENAPHCFCIDFCVKRPGQPNGYVPALFTHVGNYAIAPGMGFDSSGLTNDAQKNAFTGSLDLVGVLPGGIATNAMEYRFIVKNGATVLNIDANYLDAFQIGTLNRFTFSPFSYTSDPYMVNSPGATHNVVVDPQGWIRVPREDALFGSGQFNAGTLLGTLNTVKLMENGFGIRERYAVAPLFDLTTAPVYVAGDAFPPVKQAGTHTFEIIFQAREVGSSTIAYETTLPRIVLSNVEYLQKSHPSWGGDVAKAWTGVCVLEIAETTAKDEGCNKVGTSLTANYSVVHPFIDSLRLSFEGNPVLPTDVFVPASGAAKLIASELFNTSALQPCAYIVKLEAWLRLTNGYYRPGNAYMEDHIAFCKA